MARRKRASMREGPLAALFRSTLDDSEVEEPREFEPGGRERLQRPGETGPDASEEPTRVERAPQGEEPTRHMPAVERPGAATERAPEPVAPQREEAPAPTPPEPDYVTAYRAESEQGVRAPKERLRQVFADDMPADMLEGPMYGREAPDPNRPPVAPVVRTPIIRVIGVGGAGVNAVNRMVEAGIPGVEFMAINTDLQSLQQSTADVTVHIGGEVTRGLGSGSDPKLGYQAAFEEQDKIKRLLKGSDMVFVTAGAGGGTGTGAAPVIARLARDVGALTVGIVTRPFSFEGTRRAAQAEEGVDALGSEVDTLIVVPNERLLSILEQTTTMVEAFKVADDVLRQGVQGISDLVTLPGLINLDFADVRTIMADAGPALLGIGMAIGDNRAVVAAEKAISSPLLETSMEGARSILLSITGGDGLSLVEVSEAARVVQEAAHDDANIIFGANVDDAIGDQVWVTVIATRFDSRARPVRSNGAAREQERPPRRPASRNLAPSDRPTGLDIEVPEFLPR